MCPSSASAAPGRFFHRRPHQQDQNMGTSCISSCSRCPSGFQGPCPEQEASKPLPGTLHPRSPACSQPGKAIKQEEQTDLSRKLREEAAAIWSWRKQEHNPWLPLPAASLCFPECPQLQMPELISWCSLGTLNPGASTTEASAPPSYVPGKSQRSGVTSSSLGTDPACLHRAGFCPCPQSLSPLTPSSPGHTWFF